MGGRQTGAVDSATLDKNKDGVAESTQALTAGSNCSLSTNGSLLGFQGYVGTATTNQASFSSDSNGVAKRGPVSPGGTSVAYVPDHAPAAGVTDEAMAALESVDVLIEDAQFFSTGFATVAYEGMVLDLP